MVLLITSIACGLLSACAAVILQFRLTFWMFLSGLHSISPEKKANIDIHRLRRRLSVLLYFLSFSLIGGSLFLYLKVITELVAIPLFIGVIFFVFNGVYFLYRKFDRNAYSDKARRASRFFLIAVDLFFVLLVILFIQ